MTRLILVRHAEPAIDPEVPAAQWPLSAQGRAQALALAAHPALADARAVYASTEPKARGTAAPLAARLGVPLRAAPGLGEQQRPVLPWTGPADRQRLIAAMFAQPEAAVTGCEPIARAQRRIVTCIAALRRAGDDLVLVSHGTVLHLYLAWLRGVPPNATTWARIGIPDLAVVDPERRIVLREFGRT